MGHIYVRVNNLFSFSVLVIDLGQRFGGTAKVSVKCAMQAGKSVSANAGNLLEV